MRQLKAFLWGMWEFRRSFTRHYGGDLIEYYDSGRDLAHLITLRKWDDTAE